MDHKELPSVLVMMATYNGERYVAEQIESILAQEDVEVDLLISDDGSSDKTVEICQMYADRFSNIIFERNRTNKGSTDTFLGMLHAIDPLDHDYYAFSDQDDLWLPEKLSCAIKMLESHRDRPCLYYSDVINYDFDQNAMVGSGREYYPFASYAQSLPTLLMANWASGNTMVFNNKLASLAQRHYPKSFPRYHDSWIHLIALSCGETIPDLSNAHIVRRIHAHNEVGMRVFGKMSIDRIANAMQMITAGPTHDLVDSARCLFEGYDSCMDNESKQIVEEFIKVNNGLNNKLSIVLNEAYRLPSVLDTAMSKMRILFNRA